MKLRDFVKFAENKYQKFKSILADKPALSTPKSYGLVIFSTVIYTSFELYIFKNKIYYEEEILAQSIQKLPSEDIGEYINMYDLINDGHSIESIFKNEKMLKVIIGGLDSSNSKIQGMCLASLEKLSNYGILFLLIFRYFNFKNHLDGYF